MILVSLVMNWRGDLITDPQVTLEGLLEGDLEADAKEDIADAVKEALVSNRPSVIEIPVAEYFPPPAPTPGSAGR